MNNKHISVPVHVIDGVRPVVFRVPGKAREAHTNITPWHLKRVLNNVQQ
jgi:hypothetical protein